MKIGITGKPGSGKSYLSKWMSEQLGIKLIHFNSVAAKMLNRPEIKTQAENLLGVKMPTPTSSVHENMQLFSIFEHSKFFTPEFWNYLNKVQSDDLNQLLDEHSDVIVDYNNLLQLDNLDRFDAIILIQADEEERCKHLQMRHAGKFSLEQIKKVDKSQTDFIKHDPKKCDYIVINNYEGIPKQLQEITFKLKPWYERMNEVATEKYIQEIISDTHNSFKSNSQKI